MYSAHRLYRLLENIGLKEDGLEKTEICANDCMLWLCFDGIKLFYFDC